MLWWMMLARDVRDGLLLLLIRFHLADLSQDDLCTPTSQHTAHTPPHLTAAAKKVDSPRGK